MSTEPTESDCVPLIPECSEVTASRALVERDAVAVPEVAQSGGRSRPATKPADLPVSVGSRIPEPGSGIRRGRPPDPRFAAFYLAVRDTWPEIATERGRRLKAHALFTFAVIRRLAPDLLAWFANGHTFKTKALAALARFDEPSIVLVARHVVAEDMSVLGAIAFCDLVHAEATS